MRRDVQCPYCDEWQEINHDDGYGYKEDEYHQQQCCDCDKNFVYLTSISFYYESQKADCLNDADHKWKKQTCYPPEYAKMVCDNCGETKDCEPTETPVSGEPISNPQTVVALDQTKKNEGEGLDKKEIHGAPPFDPKAEVDP